MESKIISEKDLIDLVKKDYEKAARILINIYGEYLTNKAIFWGLGEEDAEEVVSDIMLLLLNEISSNKFVFEGEGKLKGWLNRCLRNRCLDIFRKTEKVKKEITKFTYDESEFDFQDPENKSRNIIDVVKFIVSQFNENVKEDERKNLITDTFNKLSKVNQLCIRCYLNNAKHKEIGEMINCTEDAAKKRVGRALMTFCNKIAEKLNKNSKEIYDRLKEIHKQDTKGRIT